ncbi:ABC transporter ATP-binding protein [Breoghania sp.]|uniref:ABC transporter ATP-binding protein n=1 Tax=Breoghania sp. TaxID=2065378 RepID=UPI002619BD2E|nr:ABC transporter ATP-binding protein [Breoghania sp.]MDJ0930911.1 ABC transporter ATP-binding protein [Breoghania sp.]
MASIRLENVRKRFGNVDVIKGIDLEIEDGEFVVLVDPSGCGNSTLLNLISGLETISSGDVKIGDKRVNTVPPKDRDIALVSRSYALYPTKNVHDNITFGMQTRKVPVAEQQSALKEVSEMLHIDHLLNRRPGQLSGGQRQRVAMGRSLVRKPEVLLFDESICSWPASWARRR